jgi:TRAP-type C4-dicarboxylate transport system permease small subunit
VLKILGKIDNYFAWIENKILVIIPLLLVIMTISAVFNRYFIKRSMSWNEELAMIFFMLFVYWGISNIARDDAHLSVDLLLNKFKGKSKMYMKIFIWSVSLIISLCGVYFGAKMSLVTNARTSALRIPYSIIFLITIVMGFLGMSLRYFYKIVSTLESLKKI